MVSVSPLVAPAEEELLKLLCESAFDGYVQVWMGTSLSPEQGIDAPASINPNRNSSPFKLFIEPEDVRRGHFALRTHMMLVGRSDGAGAPAKWAAYAAVRYSSTFRFCCLRVAVTVIIRSMKRLPSSLWVPNDSFR